MQTLFLIAAILFFGFAQYRGLFIAPTDGMMGEVYRILFVHVPSAWMTLLFFFFSFTGSLAYLITSKSKYDRFSYCTAELGLYLNILTLFLGSVWAKPTWGVWWTWDPRLTTTTLLFVMYSGLLVLRQMIGDPERRAKVSASVGLLIFINVPIVYMSVRWWRSIHQIQSTPKNMDPDMAFTMRLSAFAFLAVCLALLWFRMRLAKRESEIELRLSKPPTQEGVE